MKAFICFLALATAANAGLIHHAPAPLALSHGGSSLIHGGGLSYGGVLDGGVALGHGLGLGGGVALGGLGSSHQVVNVVHQQPAPLLLQAPVHHSAQLVKVIHQQPAPVKVIRVINEAPLIHHAPLVHQAPAHLKVIKVLHQAPLLHSVPTGW